MCTNLILCKIENGQYGHSDLHPLIAQNAISLHAITRLRKIGEIPKALKSYRTLTLARALRENNIPYEYHHRNTIAIDMVSTGCVKKSHVLIKGGMFNYSVSIDTDDLTTSQHTVERKDYPFIDGYALVANMILDKSIYSLAATGSPDDRYAKNPTKGFSTKQYRALKSKQNEN